MRRIDPDAPACYRAVVTVTTPRGGEYVEHHGPYTTAGTARGVVTQKRRLARRYWPDSTVEGRVERAPLVWERVE